MKRISVLAEFVQLNKFAESERIQTGIVKKYQNIN